MIRWIPYTFVRTVLFFIGGITVGLYVPEFVSGPLALGCAVLLLGVYFFMVRWRRVSRTAANPGWVALLLVFLLGYMHVVHRTESLREEHLLNHHTEVSQYKVIVTRFAEEGARSWKSEVSVLEVCSDGQWHKKEGKVLLYLSKDDFSTPFQYGDILLLRGAPSIPEPPGNPGEFDYKAHLALQNIYHQHFLRGGDVIKVDHDPPNHILAIAFGCREWASATIKRFVHGYHERAIASALVLGVTDGIDDALRDAYAGTGSMHILAVSGLHVSLLYFILLRMLKPLAKIRSGRWIVAFLSVAVLWLYALVTGLSPSVLRAVTMFSFLAIAKPWARTTNIYNTLAVSAFCLLLCDPFLVRSVGFQLSYLAVLGIVYLYPRILALWEPQHLVFTELWRVSAVSLAAQIATFPVGLLYFHQFPNYFLLANIVVVPLASVVLVTGLIVLASSVVSVVAAGAGICLAWVIRFLNWLVFTLDELPFSVTENVYITSWQCALLVIFIIFVLTLFRYRKFSYMVLAFTSIVGFSALQWWNFYSEVNQSKLVVYKVPGHLALDMMEQGQTWFVADSALRRDGGKIAYHIKPNRLISGVGRIHGSPQTSGTVGGGNIMVWRGQTIALVNSPTFEFPAELAVDWLIIGNNAVAIERIPRTLGCKKVILDSSNSFFFASRFVQAAKLYKLDVHSVLHQGAFISKIENQDT